MIDSQKVIELAIKAGANMVYVWGAPPKVDDMNIMLFTKLLIEEALNAEPLDATGGHGERGVDDAPATEAGLQQTDAGTQDLDAVQQRRKGRKKAVQETSECVQDNP